MTIKNVRNKANDNTRRVYHQHWQRFLTQWAGPAISTSLFLPVLAPPVGADGVRRFFKPLLVVLQCCQRFRGEKLGCVGGWVAERFQHFCANQNGNLMGLKTEIPRRFQSVQPRGKQRQSEKRVFIFLVHGTNLILSFSGRVWV